MKHSLTYFGALCCILINFLYGNKFLLLLSTDKFSFNRKIYFFMVHWAFKFYFYWSIFFEEIKYPSYRFNGRYTCSLSFYFRSRKLDWKQKEDVEKFKTKDNVISSRRLVFLPLNWPKDVLMLKFHWISSKESLKMWF